MKNASINYKKVQRTHLPSIGYKLILTNMLQGKYSCIARRNSKLRKSIWFIYKGNMDPVRYIPKRTFNAANRFMKADKSGLHTLDLEKIERLHGNNWLKKIYNKEKLQHEVQGS